MKDFDRKDLFNWSNVENAKDYISTQGYFGNSISEVDLAVHNEDLFRLTTIFSERSQCFFSYEKGEYFGFFLPADKVKEVKKEKKYRPFKNSKELRESFYKDCFCCNGHSVEVENKQTKVRYKLLIIGEYESGIVLAYYGAISMNKLFEKFNYKVNDEWQPFGVEE